MTRIVKGYPPNIEEIRARFNPARNTVFAYGDTIYSPSTVRLSPDLVAHEETHFAQQAREGGPEAWWWRYMHDDRFRLAQEVEAYRVQYATAAALPRAQRRALLAHICRSLASSMYGGLVTREDARTLILEMAT